MPNISLILGGARSGKSRYAEELANLKAKEVSRVIYIATAQALDDEMQNRINKHQNDRAHYHWQTIEEPIQLAKLINTYNNQDTLLLIECLTLWMSNLLHYKKQPEINLLLSALETSQANIIMVSNETGLGIIPEDKLSRQFIDEIGILHQNIASLADSVYFCIAGIPTKIKG